MGIFYAVVHYNVVNNIDANVQRLLLEALDGVVHLRYPVDQVGPVHVGHHRVSASLVLGVPIIMM